MVMPYFVPYVGPEVAKNMARRVQSKAAHSLDLFGLGRIIQEILIGNDVKEFFPGYEQGSGMRGFYEILLRGTDALFRPEAIEDKGTRAILRGLLNRDPLSRVSLKKVEVDQSWC